MERYRDWLWDDHYLYEAMAGDTFGLMALRAYNDERLMSLLLSKNPRFSDVIIFEGGEIVTIPVINEALSAVLPPWRTGEIVASDQ